VTGSIRDLFRAEVGRGGFDLTQIDTEPTAGVGKHKAAKEIARDQARLLRWQERLTAEASRALLIVLQGMDTAGKDGTISHVIRSMNPQACRITAFKEPTTRELAHDFLWRIRRALPAAGQVGVFNRSHYEDVVIVRVNSLVPEDVWRPRFARINRFEKRLRASGTMVVKIFLHISFEEQRRRLLKRLEDPDKHWKFEPGDLDKRDQWASYMAAYGDAIARCSTDAAPWYVVPSDAKWFRNWAVGRLLLETLQEMDPLYPEPALDISALEARLEK